MADWTSGAQQSANQDMRSSSPSDPALKCKPKEWEPVIEVEDSPQWEAKIEAASPEEAAHAPDGKSGGGN